MITGFDHVQLAMLRGREPEAWAFYAGLFGMTELPKPAALAPRGGCWFASGSAVLHLGVEEPFERGWYAGPVGWTDRAEDGEFCVALRCALLRGRIAHCYAGCGIVRDSDPSAELAESEVKLQALLPLLAS